MYFQRVIEQMRKWKYSSRITSNWVNVLSYIPTQVSHSKVILKIKTNIQDNKHINNNYCIDGINCSQYIDVDSSAVV